MKESLFEVPLYRYEISDWEFKKNELLNCINKQKFVRKVPYENNVFLTHEGDRQTNKKTYVRYLSELLIAELNEFCQEAKVTCKMTDAWCVRYKKGDYQGVHNHRGYGFSGIIYLEYDSKVHSPTSFVDPFHHPINDCTNICTPQYIKEGVMVIFPSSILHYVEPNNVNKPRMAVSFDLLPETPKHRRV